MALIQTVHLSMANFKSAPVVPAVQNDTDRQIKMVIDDFDLTAGLTGKITFVRSDGTHYEANATLDTATNSFTADIDQALTQPGRTMVQLKVTDTLTVSTFSFVIFVEKDTSGTVIPQEGIDLVTAVQAAETAQGKAEDAETGALAAERAAELAQAAAEAAADRAESGEKITILDKAVNYASVRSSVIDPTTYPTYPCVVRATPLLSVSGELYKSAQIPLYGRFSSLTITPNTANCQVTFLKTSLPSTVTNGMDISSYLATGETGRHVAEGGGDPITVKVPSSAKYALVSLISNGNSGATPTSVVGENVIYSLLDTKVDKPSLGILVLGNSFSQDSFAYLPPVLNELLPEYSITYCVAYTSSAGVQDHIDFYTNSTAYTWTNLWKPGASAWTRYAGGGANEKTLADIISMAHWDFVYFQGRGGLSSIVSNVIMPGRDLIILLNQLLSYPFVAATGSWLTSNDTFDQMATAMETVKSRLGVNHIIPVGTGIANARTNPTLQALGEDALHDMLYDGTHQQSGLPALISAYVIANYIVKMLGHGERSVYNSSFVPSTANCIAINAYKEAGMTSPYPMTHGDSVGVSTGNIRAAQQIATLAVNNPFTISDCSYVPTD